MRPDGLYLNATWVAAVDFALTLQANDLQKPDSLQASYTNAVNLPDSLLVRGLLDGAEQIDAGGVNPYRKLAAYVVQEGEVVFRGVAILKQFSGGWNVELDDDTADLFEALRNKPLRRLDLSRLNHAWSVEQMTYFNQAGLGLVYPLIDYGTMSTDDSPSDALFPAVKVRTLIDQMLVEQGYKAAGAWTQDPLLDRLAIPFTEDQPNNSNSDFVTDRQARVTVSNTGDIELDYAYNGLLSKDRLNQIIPFNVDAGGSFSDGKKDNFKPGLYGYVADTALRLHVTASQFFTARVNVGAPEIKLIVEKNGVPVGEQGYWSKAGPYNNNPIGGIHQKDNISVDTHVDLKPNDVVKIRLIVEKRTFSARYNIKIHRSQDSVSAGFEPDVEIEYGDTWPVAFNLPDLKCIDLLVTIAELCCGWFLVNKLRRTVTLVRVDETIHLPADNWNRLVDTSQEPTYTPSLAGYGRANYLKWKEQDSVTPGYGDGKISCNAENMDAEATLFTLPFAASVPSGGDITGYGKPLLIKTRTISGSGDSKSISKNATAPRLILLQPDSLTTVSTKILNAEGNTVTTSVTLMGCWFAIRQPSLVRENNAFSLCFDKVASQFKEQSLIERYYTALKRILRRPRVLQIAVMLSPADAADLQIPDPEGNTGLMRPKELRMIRVGAQDISAAHFIVSKIDQYRDGVPCSATLIGY